MLKIVSFNCNSLRKRMDTVRDLAQQYDIICLQELLIFKENLFLLNEIDSNFDHVSFVCDNSEDEIVEGRPKNGVAILWRNDISDIVKLVKHDDRVIGITLDDGYLNVLLLNIYMPCDKQNMSSLNEYQNYLQSINNIINEFNTNNIIIVGDCNADPKKGRFWRYFNEYCIFNNLIVKDLLLPDDSFTYLCPAKSTTSWLDHIVSSRSIQDKIQNVSILYDFNIFDHFPISFELNIETDRQNNVIYNRNEVVDDFVLWHKLSNRDLESYTQKIKHNTDLFQLTQSTVWLCSDIHCKDENHLNFLNHSIHSISKVLLNSSSQFNVSNFAQNRKIVPGWNDNCKSYYKTAQLSFKIWKENGRQVQGQFVDIMKRDRKKFKDALRYCKQNEERIKNEKLVSSLNNKNNKVFWKQINKQKNKNKKLKANLIDGVSTIDEKIDVFSNKFKKLYYSNEHNAFDNDNFDLSNVRMFEAVGRFTYKDINKAITSLNPNIGPDNIHSNHLKFAPDIVLQLLANFFSSCIIHSFVPNSILLGIIKPLIKDKMGDINSSSNYRPIISSSVYLKVLELCIKEKITPYVSFNSRQHGFRPDHSTASAAFVLKETISSYINKGSCVYSCFLDLSKAFDNVSHKQLIEKLFKFKIPVYLIRLINSMFINQHVKLEYEHEVSMSWPLNKGVRQGGILSPLFFNIYINDVLNEISSLKIGCEVGFVRSNVVAYADDIVLLSPSASGLKSLLQSINQSLTKLNLEINQSKTVCMKFAKSHKKFIDFNPIFEIGNHKLENVNKLKYLGYILTNDLSNEEDIKKCTTKFFSEFNCILRNFNYVDYNVLLKLFRSYCLCFYGLELWFDFNNCSHVLAKLEMAYHKAVKKIFKVSDRVSNHDICTRAELLTFRHYISLTQVKFLIRIRYSKPCDFVKLTHNILFNNSVQILNIIDRIKRVYSIDNFWSEDCDAICSRIGYINEREDRLR